MSKQHVFFEHTLYTLQVDNSMLKNMHHHHVCKMDQTQNKSIFFVLSLIWLVIQTSIKGRVFTYYGHGEDKLWET
jgi:hypothetical protein